MGRSRKAVAGSLPNGPRLFTPTNALNPMGTYFEKSQASGGRPIGRASAAVEQSLLHAPGPPPDHGCIKQKFRGLASKSLIFCGMTGSLLKMQRCCRWESQFSSFKWLEWAPGFTVPHESDRVISLIMRSVPIVSSMRFVVDLRLFQVAIFASLLLLAIAWAI